MTRKKLILASGSPRRNLLMKEAGYEFEIKVADVDESHFMKPPPEVACVNAAIAKAKAVNIEKNEVLLAADTIVWFNGKITGKSKTDKGATEMLFNFSNKLLDIYTGVAIRTTSKMFSEFVHSRLKFRKFSKEEIEKYVEAGLSKGRAGSFTIRGYGTTLIESIEGEYSNIEGLPMQKVFKMLKKVGISPEIAKSAYRKE